MIFSEKSLRRRWTLSSRNKKGRKNITWLGRALNLQFKAMEKKFCNCCFWICKKDNRLLFKLFSPIKLWLLLQTWFWIIKVWARFHSSVIGIKTESMRGETMKIELVNHECHTNLVQAVTFTFASAVTVSCFYIENGNEKKYILLNTKCLLLFTRDNCLEKSACKNLFDYQELMFYFLQKYLTKIWLCISAGKYNWTDLLQSSVMHRDNSLLSSLRHYVVLCIISSPQHNASEHIWRT